MGTDRGPQPDSSRETRLLLITIAVSAVVLLLLARFRFPEPQRTAGAPALAPAPALERLAARATYDELAAIVVEVQQRVAPSVLVLRLDRADDPGPPPAARGGAATSDGRFVPAVRVSRDTAVALLGPGARVGAVVNRQGAIPALLGVDPVSGLALLKVPEDAAFQPPPLRTTDTVPTPAYVALVEGTRGGPVVRPVFFGRTDAVADPRWPGMLLVAGGTLGAQPGSLVFTLDGSFAGLAVLANHSFGLVPARSVLTAATELARAVPPAGGLGIEVQDLTAALAAATGAGHGAVVAYVEAEGPAAGTLRVGDVIESFEGDAILGADDLRVRVARSAAGREIALRVRRGGALQEVKVTAGSPEPKRAASPSLGLVLRDVRGVGAEVMRVSAGSTASAAGLLPGDVITHLDGDAAPTAATLNRRFRELTPPQAAILGVRRGAGRLVLTLAKR